MKLLEMDARVLHNFLLEGARVINLNAETDILKMGLLEFTPDSLSLTTSNNMVLLNLAMPVATKVTETVSFCLPLANPKLYPNDKLGKWLGYVTDLVSLDWNTEKQVLTLRAGKNQMTLSGREADEYPLWLPWVGETHVQVEGSVLQNLIKRTIFAIAEEGDSPLGMKLEGVWVKHDLTCAAAADTSATVLAGDYQQAIDIKTDGIVIPRLTWRLVKDVFSNAAMIEYETNQRGMRFSTTINERKIVLIGRQMEMRFPDLFKVAKRIQADRINKGTLTEGTLQATDLLKALAAALTFVATENTYGKMGFKPAINELLLSATDAETGATELVIEAEFSGKLLPIYLSGKYLQEGLRPLNNEKVKISSGNDGQALSLEPVKDGGYLYLAMSMVEPAKKAS